MSSSIAALPKATWINLSLVFVVTVGAAIRLLPLPHEALTGDELFSRRVAMMPMVESLAAIKADLVHPPLYYFLLRATMIFCGSGALGVRAFSFLCGVASLWLLYSLTTYLCRSRFMGILAAAALALNTAHIVYSEEGRSYAWYTLVVILLALWTARITRRDLPEPRPWLWCAGAAVMMTAVYTHYVGGIYVACAVLSILVTEVSRRSRLLAFCCGLFAALTFVPWLVTEIAVYHAKRGLAENLGWQGTPTLYDLKAVYASSLGVPAFGGATTMVVLVIIVLVGSAIVLVRADTVVSGEPGVRSLVLIAAAPPLMLFALSRPPIDLPLFGLRHLLPSVPLLIVGCSIGLKRISDRVSSKHPAASVIAAACLLLIPITSTGTFLWHLPSRFPYDTMSMAVRRYAMQGFPAYTTWFYGTAEPVNFYCGTMCVRDLPPSDVALPMSFVLLYRPDVADETERFKKLRAAGYKPVESMYYSNGAKTTFGTTVVRLAR